MIDMAVGIVIGTAFNNVISTIVKSIVMPPLSMLTDGVKLSNRKYVLRSATDSTQEVAVGYGELIEVMIDFFIIAFTIFLVIKLINRFKRRSDDPHDQTVETPKDIELLSNIEKLMEEQNALLKNKGTSYK